MATYTQTGNTLPTGNISKLFQLLREGDSMSLSQSLANPDILNQILPEITADPKRFDALKKQISRAFGGLRGANQSAAGFRARDLGQRLSRAGSSIGVNAFSRGREIGKAKAEDDARLRSQQADATTREVDALSRLAGLEGSERAEAFRQAMARNAAGLSLTKGMKRGTPTVTSTRTPRYRGPSMRRTVTHGPSQAAQINQSMAPRIGFSTARTPSSFQPGMIGTASRTTPGMEYTRTRLRSPDAIAQGTQFLSSPFRGAQRSGYGVNPVAQAFNQAAGGGGNTQTLRAFPTGSGGAGMGPIGTVRSAGSPGSSSLSPQAGIGGTPTGSGLARGAFGGGVGSAQTGPNANPLMASMLRMFGYGF